MYAGAVRRVTRSDADGTREQSAIRSVNGLLVNAKASAAANKVIPPGSLFG